MHDSCFRGIMVSGGSSNEFKAAHDATEHVGGEPHHLRRCDGVHVLGGEALQQGGLASVVQPQEHDPDLLLCGSLQFFNDRE